MSNTITSDEVNYLVYRYLQECGFVHAAFTFGYESRVFQSGIDGSLIPSGALLSFLQRGVSYAEIEAHIAQTGTNNLISGKQALYSSQALAENGAVLKKAPTDSVSVKTPNGAVQLVDVHRALVSRRRTVRDSEKDTPDIKLESGHALQVGVPQTIKDSEVTTLYGHTAEAFVIAWNPKRPYLLASGSGDATARLWAIPSGPCGRTAVGPPLELRNYEDSRDVPAVDSEASVNHSMIDVGAPKSRSSNSNGGGLSRDVTAVSWSSDGTRLATASYDGIARIWSDAGVLEHRLITHSGPVLSLKWSTNGQRLVTSSVDHTTVVWDASRGSCEQQFEYHRAPALDVDWQSEDTFASSSSDKMVYVCRVGDSKPLRVFYGHQDEVNSVGWDTSGTLLATGSDDCTVKVWKPNRDKTSATVDLQQDDNTVENTPTSTKCDYLIRDYTEHSKEVYAVRWGPKQRPVLASASFDGTIRIWDPSNSHASSTMVLARHLGPVYTVAFSPCGDYLASGSSDRRLMIWNLRDGGTLIRLFRGQGGIFEVSWNPTGNKIAAALSNGTINVIDMRV